MKVQLRRLQIDPETCTRRIRAYFGQDKLSKSAFPVTMPISCGCGLPCETEGRASPFIGFLVLFVLGQGPRGAPLLHYTTCRMSLASGERSQVHKRLHVPVFKSSKWSNRDFRRLSPIWLPHTHFCGSTRAHLISKIQIHNIKIRTTDLLMNLKIIRCIFIFFPPMHFNGWLGTYSPWIPPVNCKHIV